MARLASQISTGVLLLGELSDADDLARNLTENAVPGLVAEVTAGSYPEFPSARR